MKSQFITPVVTVLDSQGRLDAEQNQRVYDHLVKGGVSGMVIMGSTGEFFSLDMKRSRQLIDIATGFAKGRFRVFVGASRMDPDESVELANYAVDKGADGVMIVSPYYFRLNDASIYEYYSSIAAKTPAKIFLYNFPDRTGYSISPAVTLKLATRFRNITGFKDTILDTNHTCELIGVVRPELPDFEIFSGYDNNFAHNILAGGNGCIGGLSNLVPEFFASWMAAIDAEDLTKIAAAQQFVDRMMAIYGIGEPFIPIMKKAMVLRGIIGSDVCTRPFLTANAEQTARIAALLGAMGIGKAASKPASPARGAALVAATP